MQINFNAIARGRGHIAQTCQLGPGCQPVFATLRIMGKVIITRAQDGFATPAINNDHITARNPANNIRSPQNGRNTQRTGHNRSMAFGPAKCGDKGRHLSGLEPGHIGRADFFGNQNGALGRRFKCAVGFTQQAAHQTQANLADIGCARGNISIINTGKLIGDFVDDFTDRVNRIHVPRFDQFLGPAYKPRLGQHMHIGIHQKTKFF